MEGRTTVGALYDAFTSGELADGYRCYDEVNGTVDGCGSVGRTVNTTAPTPDGWPRVIAITLNRFAYNPATALFPNLTTHVDFPHVWSPHPTNSYVLRAVIVHHGDAADLQTLDDIGGHYTAYVCDSSDVWLR